jgi:hypothetical protein
MRTARLGLAEAAYLITYEYRLSSAGSNPGGASSPNRFRSAIYGDARVANVFAFT